ncbi:MAG TPA: EcsC family protein [Bacillales bacterium]|nr:EcsC family protein [Bacillales bacterium]
MQWTQRDEKVWNEIQRWENEAFQNETNPLVLSYEKWIEAAFAKLNDRVQVRILNTIDTLLFHLHALIRNSQFQFDAKQRLLNEARLFNNDIEGISDLKKLSIDQLRYITSQHIARQRLISFAQGGLTGTGGFLLLGIDFPAVLTINLRSVQLIAMNYGYEIELPGEMLTALKVFHMAALPKRLQGEAWNKLEEEIYQEDYDPYFFEDDTILVNSLWFEHTMKQIVKTVTIQMLRKKVVQGIPLLGMAFGAGMNYQFSRQVTEMAHQFYQKRYLFEKNLEAGS